MKIVNTDNFGGDYPNESFVNLPPLKKSAIKLITFIINKECSGNDASRYWKVVEDSYKLAPIMEDELRNK